MTQGLQSAACHVAHVTRWCIWKKNLHWNIRLNEARAGRGTKRKPGLTLCSWSDMRPTFHLDREGGHRGRLSPVHYFCFLFLCPLYTHILAVQWIFNLALISCVPDETNTDSHFTFVKAPAAAGLVPHTPGDVHTNTHAYAHSLWLRPSPSWGLQEEQTRHKMALAALSCTQRSHLQTCTVCVMFLWTGQQRHTFAPLATSNMISQQ